MLYKYPRTYHLPWSEGRSDDDKIMKDLSCMEGKNVVVTVKMDGENTSLYHDHIHARSLDSNNHPSRNWVKKFWSEIKHEIPSGMRICGENMYAKHSIFYENLKSYFYGFSVWNENICLEWNESVEWMKLLGIYSVETLYYGKFDVNVLKKISEELNTENMEGYVVRNIESFQYDEFNKNVCKFVRAGHVQTNKHWTTQEIIPNVLK